MRIMNHKEIIEKIDAIMIGLTYNERIKVIKFLNDNYCRQCGKKHKYEWGTCACQNLK